MISGFCEYEFQHKTEVCGIKPKAIVKDFVVNAPVEDEILQIIIWRKDGFGRRTETCIEIQISSQKFSESAKLCLSSQPIRAPVVIKAAEADYNARRSWGGGKRRGKPAITAIKVSSHLTLMAKSSSSHKTSKRRARVCEPDSETYRPGRSDAEKAAAHRKAQSQYYASTVSSKEVQETRRLQAAERRAAKKRRKRRDTTKGNEEVESTPLPTKKIEYSWECRARLEREEKRRAHLAQRESTTPSPSPLASSSLLQRQLPLSSDLPIPKSPHTSTNAVKTMSWNSNEQDAIVALNQMHSSGRNWVPVPSPRHQGRDDDSESRMSTVPIASYSTGSPRAPATEGNGDDPVSERVKLAWAERQLSMRTTFKLRSQPPVIVIILHADTWEIADYLFPCEAEMYFFDKWHRVVQGIPIAVPSNRFPVHGQNETQSQKGGGLLHQLRDIRPHVMAPLGAEQRYHISVLVGTRGPLLRLGAGAVIFFIWTYLCGGVAEWLRLKIESKASAGKAIYFNMNKLNKVRAVQRIKRKHLSNGSDLSGGGPFLDLEGNELGTIIPGYPKDLEVRVGPEKVNETDQTEEYADSHIVQARLSTHSDDVPGLKFVIPSMGVIEFFGVLLVADVSKVPEKSGGNSLLTSRHWVAIARDVCERSATSETKACNSVCGGLDALDSAAEVGSDMGGEKKEKGNHSGATIKSQMRSPIYKPNRWNCRIRSLTCKTRPSDLCHIHCTMPQKPWGTDEQVELLRSLIPDYLQSKPTNDQADFFTKLDTHWFDRWPEEAACKIPLPDLGVALTMAQSDVLASALRQRKKRVEVYQRHFADRVKAELARIPDDAERLCVHENGCENRGDDVIVGAGDRGSQVKIDELIATAAEKKPSAAEGERTPESVQISLDELNDIVARFHAMLEKTTGWVGFAMYGGATPNAGGALTAPTPVEDRDRSNFSRFASYMEDGLLWLDALKPKKKKSLTMKKVKKSTEGQTASATKRTAEAAAPPPAAPHTPAEPFSGNVDPAAVYDLPRMDAQWDSSASYTDNSWQAPYVQQDETCPSVDGLWQFPTPPNGDASTRNVIDWSCISRASVGRLPNSLHSVCARGLYMLSIREGATPQDPQVYTVLERPPYTSPTRYVPRPPLDPTGRSSPAGESTAPSLNHAPRHPSDPTVRASPAGRSSSALATGCSSPAGESTAPSSNHAPRHPSDPTVRASPAGSSSNAPATGHSSPAGESTASSSNHVPRHPSDPTVRTSPAGSSSNAPTSEGAQGLTLPLAKGSTAPSPKHAPRHPLHPTSSASLAGSSSNASTSEGAHSLTPVSAKNGREKAATHTSLLPPRLGRLANVSTARGAIASSATALDRAMGKGKVLQRGREDSSEDESSVRGPTTRDAARDEEDDDDEDSADETPQRVRSPRRQMVALEEKEAPEEEEALGDEEMGALGDGEQGVLGDGEEGQGQEGRLGLAMNPTMDEWRLEGQAAGGRRKRSCRRTAMMGRSSLSHWTHLSLAFKGKEKQIKAIDDERWAQQQRREKDADKGIYTIPRPVGLAPVDDVLMETRPKRAIKKPVDPNQAQEKLDARLLERFAGSKRKSDADTGGPNKKRR
ncbi:hypothetical protein K438DRAFT_1746709 [Mycena galopus ATCC 62051]|nr:hypothetical protein K438DRAFT_1746709 [Mycena galopus ATCC 62051]